MLKQELPIWVKERNQVLAQDGGVEWRGGKCPDYSDTDANRAGETKYNHAAGTLDAIAENLVPVFEMGATFKTNRTDWLPVVQGKFRMSTNGGQEYTAEDVIREGTYNLFLGDSEQYSGSQEDYPSSYKLFHDAFLKGFHWE